VAAQAPKSAVIIRNGGPAEKIIQPRFNGFLLLIKRSITRAASRSRRHMNKSAAARWLRPWLRQRCRSARIFPAVSFASFLRLFHKSQTKATP